MNTQKLWMLLFMSLAILGCSSDDDGNNQQSTEDLLTSGKWYFESITPGSYTDCEKKGYIQFMSNGTAIINSFEDFDGPCESLGAITVSYTLTNNVNLTLTFAGETQNAVIEAISSNSLRVSNPDDGEIIEFDKTEG